MDLRVSEMMEYQRRLQQRHPEWGGLVPKRARDQLLWSVGEYGEALQLIKKLGEDRVINDPAIRADFIEEIGDVMMYLWDALMCLGVDADEFSRVYAAKCGRNVQRDYVQEHVERYGEDPSTEGEKSE